MKRLSIFTVLVLMILALAPIQQVMAMHLNMSGIQVPDSRSDLAKKFVCVTFDDGWQNQYDNALPILQQNGLKATFAIVTSWIGQGSGEGKAMGMAELNQLSNQGMDIASHTVNHPHLPTLDAVSLQNEVSASKTSLQQAGFSVRTIVYPYFEYNSSVITEVKNAGYLCGRTGGLNHPFDPATTNPDDKFTIDAIEINNQNISQFQSIVSQAGEHSVICLCYHSVSDSSSAPAPRTPVANFADQMAYLKNNGFTVVLLPDLIQNPWITLSPTSMSFSGVQGGANPPVQTLNISNSGGGTLTWTAADDAAWLTLSPASGTAPGTVAATVNTSGLTAGTYNGSITISAAGASNTPQTVTVVLAIQTPSPNWLTGWSYRKQISVTGSTAAQTNYQMKLTVNRSTGTDSGSSVFVGTKCESDYRDIRFTKSDGITPLDYWVESATTSSAVIWVELDSLPASPAAAVFNMYYGNSSAAASTNIKNTFVFGDDFDDGTLDTARWSTGGGTGGSVTEANGVLTVTAGASNQKYAASISTYNNAYALHARAKLDSITGCTSYRLLGFVTTKGSYNAKHFTSGFRWYKGDTNFIGLSGNNSSSAQINMNVAADTNYHISECRRYAVGTTNYDQFILDGGSQITGTKPTNVARYIYIDSDDANKSITVDWIFLRKFVSPEPAWGTWGAEQTP